MKVRITFRSEIYIEGKDMDEIAGKWQNIPLFSKEAYDNSAEFIEISSAENAETYEEISTKLL